MAVLSAQDVERFTPERYLVDGAVPPGVPVYLIAGMTRRERARFRAQMVGEGARYPQDAEIIKAARAVIAELAPTTADELLAAVSAYEEMLAEPALPPPPAEESDDEAAARKKEADRRLGIRQAYDALLDMLRQHPAVGSLLSLRVLFFEIVPSIAAAYALRGWENLETKFERVNGVVPDRALEMLPDDDILEIGNKALAMQSVSSAQKGN